MATITGQTIVDYCEKILLDDTNVRFAEAELLNHLNESQRLVVLSKPDAYVKNTAVQLVAGTKQTIPTDGVSLIRVTRNMGTDGLTPGNATRWADLESLDNARPEWHTDAASATVKNWLQDPLDQKNFYVSPPQPGASMGYVDLIYSASPAELASLASTITIDDIYAAPLKFLILSLALAKEGPTQDLGKSSTYYQTAMTLLGVKSNNEQAINMNK